LVTLFVLPPFEKHIASDWYAKVTITGAVEPVTEQELRERIEALGPVVKAIRLSYDVESKSRTVVFELKLVKRQAMNLCTKVVAELSRCPGVQLVRWS
jgi:N-glycosylase/DNA lyase